MDTLPFALASALTLAAALLVVRARNLVHAALALGLALVGTAALFAILEASFLAAVQVLLYVGGVMTLMLFGIMITRRHETLEVPAASEGTGRAAAASVALFTAIASAIVKTPGLDASPAPKHAGMRDLGHAIVSTHLLAFEALSALLLAAIVGAIVIARRKDPVARAGEPTLLVPREAQRRHPKEAEAAE